MCRKNSDYGVLGQIMKARFTLNGTESDSWPGELWTHIAQHQQFQECWKLLIYKVYDPVYNFLPIFLEHRGNKRLKKGYSLVILACHAHVTICIIELNSIKYQENPLWFGFFSFIGNLLGDIQKMTPIGGHLVEQKKGSICLVQVINFLTFLMVYALYI